MWLTFQAAWPGTGTLPDLYRHDLFFLRAEMLLYRRYEFVGHLLHIALGILSGVFAQAIFLQAFDMLNGIPPDIPDGYFGMFSFSLAFLYQFPSSFFCQRG